jgi:hypothetical protein
MGAAMSKDYAGYKSNGDPDAVYWMGQLRKGLEYRKKAANEASWKQWNEYYRGNFSGDTLPVNIFFKMIRTLVPRTYFRDPTVSITQEKPGDLYAFTAQILERVDNKLLRQMKFKQQIKMAVQDACMYGTGFMKLGFGAQYTPTPGPFSTEAPTVKKHDYRVEYSSLVLENMPWTMRVHPRNMVWPDKCTTFDNARWCAHLESMHIDDLREDPRFKHAKEIEPSKPIQNTFNKTANADALPDGHIQVAEFRDKKSGMVFVLAPYHAQKILLQDQDVFTQEHNHFPVFPIVFNADPEHCWGLADSKILEPQQRELNEIRTQEMRHRRHAIVKLLAVEGAIQPDEVEKLDGEDVGAVVVVSELGSVTPFPAVGNMPTALLEMDQAVQREVQEILGLGSNQFGEYAPGSADRSATEAQIVNQATQIRMDERRDTVADVTEDIVRGMHSIIIDNWGEEQIVQLVGDDGAKVWVQVRGDLMKQGVYDVNVDPDTGTPVTAEARQQKALATFKLLMGNPMIDQYKLTGMLLREFHGPMYDDLLLKQDVIQKNQEQQEQKQIQMMKLEAFIKEAPKQLAAAQQARIAGPRGS